MMDISSDISSQIKEMKDEQTTKRGLISEETRSEKKSENKIHRNIHNLICPKCKSNCLIRIKDYKIIVEQCDCGNKENIIINIDEFCNGQNERNKKYCQECKRPLANISYKCLEHNNILCEKCYKNNHKNHEVKELNTNLVDFICQEHNNEFSFYCNKCKKDCCEECKNLHERHEIIDYKKNKSDLNLEETKKKIEDLKEKGQNQIDLLNEVFNKVINNLENYYKMSENINDSFQVFNYKQFKNKEELNKFNKIITKDIDKIIKYWEQNNKKDELNIMHNKIAKENHKNENKHNNINISSTYSQTTSNKKLIIREQSQEIPINEDIKSTSNIVNKNNDIATYIFHNNLTESEAAELPNNDDIKIDIELIDNIKNIKKVRIFGDKFVENNENADMVIKNNKSKIVSKIDLEKYLINNSLIITISNITDINNLSSMFNECNEIKTLEITLNINTEGIRDLSNMFLKCTSLEKLKIENIQNKYFSNVTSLRGLFANCRNLKKLPDISHFKTVNVTDMSYLFADCGAITKIPKISSDTHHNFWNTSNVTKMNGMFAKCKSLESLPDISNWNTSNVENMSFMFCGCEKIKDGDIAKLSTWDVSNVKDMNNMFAECLALTQFPRFNQIEIPRVENVSFMFYKCPNLKIPENYENENCNLKFNKDILINMKYMFYDCKLNKKNLSDWMEVNEYINANKTAMFDGCPSNEKFCNIF